MTAVDEQAGALPQDFHTTHWSLVTRAANPAAPDCLAALETLCRAYWYPLYAFARRRGHGSDEARDLTQGFFAVLLEKNYVADADMRRGRFRTFLLNSMSHYLTNEWHRERALKRGGGVPRISLDAMDAEARYHLEPADDASPERSFDRHWAETVLGSVLAQLRREFDDAGRGQRFDDLKAHLLGEPGAPAYEDLSRRLGISETGVRSVVHRLRKRFAALMRIEIARTLADPSEVDDEIRHLFQSLAA